ncbi:hypothetical protein JCGZ_05174 [Jatropha curcas]|uniref:Uncharacterized protein n=1 Tax=Jatropha curcas TaxID=180498 RepID=A0A067KTL4_JATCU|nr:hypothetical protein JCGZ_05174 [Jatropha curcas]
MARGRAFDSDASGSGSRGGRVPGRSARGRVGSIPRPSSGTSGASSSAQRPVLPPSHPSSGTSGALSSAQRPVLQPSLPSAPSSSTPVSGPLQTPAAAQSPTVQASSDPRITLSLKHLVWEEAITAMLKVAWETWEKLCADRYADFTYRMRRSGTMRLAVMEQDFLDTQENYTTARERIVTSQTDESEAESRIDEVALYLEAVGGEKKRKVYGIGSQASQFYCGSASHASAPSARPQPEHSAEEFTELRACVDDQQRQIAELRAHVMLLSGEPGAGTSSSDPAPATDRNVSTSQQQPLPSPDLDAADDTLVTPPGTTAHPAGTPPDDSTSDRVDEQPHRFDFGPFYGSKIAPTAALPPPRTIAPQNLGEITNLWKGFTHSAAESQLALVSSTRIAGNGAGGRKEKKGTVEREITWCRAPEDPFGVKDGRNVTDDMKES